MHFINVTTEAKEMAKVCVLYSARLNNHCDLLIGWTIFVIL